jgi:hypothetical protein
MGTKFKDWVTTKPLPLMLLRIFEELTEEKLNEFKEDK